MKIIFLWHLQRVSQLLLNQKFGAGRDCCHRLVNCHVGSAINWPCSKRPPLIQLPLRGCMILQLDLVF